jgi:hypothetical protein
MARRGAKRKNGDRYPSGRLREPARGKAGKPTIEREQHNQIIRERLARRRRTKSQEDLPQLVDANGDIGDPFLVLDQFDQLEAAGQITDAGLAAVNQFRQDFRFSYGNRLVAVDLAKPMVSGPRAPEPMTASSVSARRKIERIIDRLGGTHSLAASCLWHVIGLEMTIADWVRVRRSDRGVEGVDQGHPGPRRRLRRAAGPAGRVAEFSPDLAKTTRLIKNSGILDPRNRGTIKSIALRLDPPGGSSLDRGAAMPRGARRLWAISSMIRSPMRPGSIRSRQSLPSWEPPAPRPKPQPPLPAYATPLG